MSNKALIQATLDTLGMFWTDGAFQHAAFLDEMSARCVKVNGRMPTYSEFSDLGKLASAYVAEQQKKQALPEVGKGATICYLSDRHAATIIKVSANGKEVTIRQDHARRTDSNGMSEIQEYEYTPNENGPESIFTLRKNGRYVKLGESMNNGLGIKIGVRREYHDYCF